MKFLHVISSVDPRSGGPLEGVLRGGEVLKRWGHERDIVCLDAPQDPGVTSCSLPVVALGHRRKPALDGARFLSWSRFGFTPALIPWLRAHARDYDVVIINGLWNYSSIGTWLALRTTRTPYYVFTHGQLDPWFLHAYPLKSLVKRLYWLLAERHVVANAAGVLFTAADEMRLAHQTYQSFRGNCHVVGYGTSPPPTEARVMHDAFRATLPRLGRRYLLFLSRIHPKKGCDILIRAFAGVSRSDPELHLVLAGPDETGWKQELSNLASELGVADRIHWPGMLSGDAKWGAYYGADAFVLPSHSENFGIVVAEALGCGTPVVITDKVNIWREIKASGAGIVSDDRIPQYQAALEEFLSLDESRRTEMRACAKRVFDHNFHIEASVLSLLKTIQSEPRNNETCDLRAATTPATL